MKPSDDETFTEVERSFFAAAPPEEPQPLGDAPGIDDLPAAPPHRPRRAIIAWLRPSVVEGRRRATLVLAVGRRAARAGAAGLVAALSIGRVARRRAVFALAGAILAAGLTAGGVAFRKGAVTKGATAETRGAVRGPTIAEAAPVVGEAAPAAIAPAHAAPRPKVVSSADVKAPRADVSNRRPPAHRRSVHAASPAPRPPETAFMDRETYWAREARSAPGRSSGPFFTR